MSEPLSQLNHLIKTGKKAIFDQNYQQAIISFEKAIKIAKNYSPALNNIIGISYANIALVQGILGNNQDALETTIRAKDFLEEILEKPSEYLAILHGLGLNFQKIDLHDCSIIILGLALDLAREHVATHETSQISIITRQLAYSYSEISNFNTAGKLFRISGDLEEQASVAVDLYKNSAYLYYKNGVKDEALNILETAFEKAGIIGNYEDQKLIARFQVTVAFEIMNTLSKNGLLNPAIEYGEVCINKSRFLQDIIWTNQMLYESALLLRKVDKIWQSNQYLEKVITEGESEVTERIRLQAIILLTVHMLETENYNRASYYLHQLDMDKISELHPLLANTLYEISQSLEKSEERGKIHSDLVFQRKDLDLPVEELLKSEEISQNFPKPEKPSSFELEELAVNLIDHQIEPNLKSPSIESLSRLFDIEEPVSPVSSIADHEPGEVDEFPSRFQEEPSVLLENVEAVTDNLTSVFSAHQEAQRSSERPQTESDFASSDTDSTGIVQARESELGIETTPDIRYEVGRRLQKAGWSVQLNLAWDIRHGAEPDIVAEKGIIRKKRKLLFFAEDVADAEICSFLLQSNLETGERIIFLLDGNPSSANVSLNVKLITRIDQLF
ncbi:MAG: tetratricopeptide repeat protein [Candidatus Hodarchaeales archaeon]|jgi:tetratricopeptide (TPR) repeat protein